MSAYHESVRAHHERRQDRILDLHDAVSSLRDDIKSFCTGDHVRGDADALVERMLTAALKEWWGGAERRCDPQEAREAGAMSWDNQRSPA